MPGGALAWFKISATVFAKPKILTTRGDIGSAHNNTYFIQLFHHTVLYLQPFHTHEKHIAIALVWLYIYMCCHGDRVE